MLEEGIAGRARDRPRADAGHRHGARPVRARRLPRARRRAGRAGARRGATGASTSRRRWCCAGSSPRAAWARRAARASTRTRSPSRATSSAVVKLDRRGDDVAIAVARQPAGELALARRDRGAGHGLERGRGQRAARWSSPRRTRRCSAPARTSRRSRRWTPPAAASCWTAMHALLRAMESLADDDDRRRQRPRARRRLRDRDGLRRAARRVLGARSASPRSTSGSSPASAARSGCRGSSARPRRSR